MSQSRKLKNKVLQIDESSFEEIALDIFYYQYDHNPIYKRFVDYLQLDISRINSLEEIPFLPIAFFKNHKIVATKSNAYEVFESSGTTGGNTSKHFVSDLDFYKKLSIQSFEDRYDSLSNYVILALLPSYLERSTSSLVCMMQAFVEETKDERSGFYLNNINELVEHLISLKKSNKKVLLVGVTFALLDLAEQFKIDLSHVDVMETGGMKGRRKEQIREEIHQTLKNSFNLENIHSEYGMTELLSQSYSKGKGVFQPSKSMKIMIREPQDPFNLAYDRAGGVNIIDLGNVDSCSFIATQDIGRMLPSGFEILGRMDNSDIRGCNLMVD